MDSWWNLGEWSGHRGHDLALHRIECPFCEEEGNFNIEFHAERKKPNGRKVLNFDTLKCGNCASFVQVFWSAGNQLHDYEVQPWPLKLSKAPEEWPENIGRYWLQAKKNIKEGSWDAATVMARSALQMALRDLGARGSTLKSEIDDLAARGTLPAIMREWSHSLRDLGNESAHPKPDQPPTDPRDARDIVKFLDFFLEYSYSLPKQINEFRARRTDT